MTEDNRDWLIIPLKGMHIVDSGDGNILCSLNFPNDATDIAPHLKLGIKMSPEEARRLADILSRAADATEVSNDN